MEELRHRAARDLTVEKPGRLAGLGVGLGPVGEGEDVGRVVDVPVLVAVPRGLREAVVERAVPGSGHLDEDAVEDAPPLLVLVEALVEELAEEAAALRDAVAQGEGDAREGVGRGGLVLEEADEVARGGEAAAGDARVAAAVDDLVDPPRLEAAVEGDPRRPGEAPGLPRQQARGGEAVVPHVEAAVPALGIDRGVREVAGVGERRLVLPLADDDDRAHEPLDRPAAARSRSAPAGAGGRAAPGRPTASPSRRGRSPAPSASRRRSPPARAGRARLPRTAAAAGCPCRRGWGPRSTRGRCRGAGPRA